MRPLSPFSHPVQQPRCKHQNKKYLVGKRCLFLKKTQISSASLENFTNSSSHDQDNVGIIRRENLVLLLKTFRNYFTLVLNKESLWKKNAYVLFWTSRELNVRNDKGKQICFAKAPREHITRYVFSTNEAVFEIL